MAGARPWCGTRATMRLCAWVVKLVDTRDLKSLGFHRPYGFDSRPGHHRRRIFRNPILIVFNLACESEHRFEGWFSSADDFEAQRTRGLLSCPVCGSAGVHKQLSAPRLNLSAQADGSAAEVATGNQGAVIDPEQRQLRELVRRVIESTEDVGTQFPEEARRIHYRESKLRPIRGVASREEAQSLAEEGIAVAHLPFPVIDKSQLN